MGIGSSFPLRGKEVEMWSSPLISGSVEVKNKWRYLSAPPHEHPQGVNEDNYLLPYSKQAVPWLGRLLAGLSPRRPEFIARPAHVELVVDNVAVRPVSLQVPRYSAVSIIPTFLHTHTYSSINNAK
jgi:hypothetical protein